MVLRSQLPPGDFAFESLRGWEAQRVKAPIFRSGVIPAAPTDGSGGEA